MHKILKKTIKYTACGIGVLLLAIILFVSILYFSADMLTPDYPPQGQRRIGTDRQSSGICGQLSTAKQQWSVGVEGEWRCIPAR